MSRAIWHMCYQSVRMHSLRTGRQMVEVARNTMIYDTIGPILCRRALCVFFYGNKIKELLRRNVREKLIGSHRATARAAIIIQQILGCSGPERLLELLPYVNGYRLPPVQRPPRESPSLSMHDEGREMLLARMAINS